MIECLMIRFSLQRVVDDLKRREDDVDRVSAVSEDLQNLLNVRALKTKEKKTIETAFQC